MITCVLFDLYGTLVDIELDEDSPGLWAALGAALGRARAPVAAREVRAAFRTILEEEAGRRGDGFIMDAAFGRLAAAFGSGADVPAIGRVFRRASLKALGLRSYVLPLFDAIHAAGSAIAIVSNTEAALTRFDLDQFPILLTADAIVLSSDVGVRKPDPEIVRLALARVKSRPDEAVLVGNDWDADVAAARAAGVRAIHLADRHDMTAAMADDEGIVHAAPSLSSILAALRLCGWRGSLAENPS